MDKWILNYDISRVSKSLELELINLENITYYGKHGIMEAYLNYYQI